MCKGDAKVNDEASSFEVRELLDYPKVLRRILITAIIWLTVSWVRENDLHF